MDLNVLLAAILANTEALNANTAAHGGTAAAAGETKAAGTTKTTKTTTTKKEPEAKGPTRDEMISLLGDVKEKFGSDEARAIIKSAGGVAKMGEIPDGKIKAVFDAATAKLGATEEPPADDDGL